MDINDLRAVFTLILMITFIMIVFWAWSRKRVKDFNEAAKIPLEEPEAPRATSEIRGDIQ